MDENKKLKEIFKDFNTNSFELSYAIIKELNYHKRKNEIDIVLISNNVILVRDLISFEEYIKNRFKINEVNIEIKQDSSIEVEELKDRKDLNIDIDTLIEKEWKDIVKYLSIKHPIARAILSKSSLKIQDGKLDVLIRINGKYVLEHNKFDELIEKLIGSLYLKKYKVNFLEEVDEEELKKLKEENEKIEEEFIKRIEEQEKEVERYKEEHKEELQKKEKQKEALAKYRNKKKAEFNSKYNNVQVVSKEVTTEVVNEEGKVETKSEVIEEVVDDPNRIYGRYNSVIENDPIKIEDINADTGNCVIEGQVQVIILDEKDEKINLDVVSKETKSGKVLITFYIFDGTATMNFKVFATKDNAKDIEKKLKKCPFVRISGVAQFDPYQKQVGVMCNQIVEIEKKSSNKREDNAEEKRVELHLHTQMSTMDGITPVEDYIKKAEKFGMKVMGITDGGSVQAFPEAHKMNNPNVKVLYGMEAYLVPDDEGSIFGIKENKKIEDTTFCVLDLETTGRSYRSEKITEIGIMKVKNGEVIEEFDELVDPEKPIPEEVVEITHISDDMVKGKPTIDVIMPKALEFIGDSVVVTHNTDFDIGWMRYNCQKLGLEFNSTYLDTLRLSKKIYTNFTKYKLGIIAEKLGIEVDVAHRALADVDTTVKVLNKMLEEIKGKGGKTLTDIDKVYEGKINWKTAHPLYATIYAKDYVGLRNLYKLVSISHLDYMYAGYPHLLKSLVTKNREGLLLGSGSAEGELYQAILQGKDDDELDTIAKFYDYLEVQPIDNNMYLVRHEQVPNRETLIEINKKIIEIGDRLELPVVATGDVHFLEPQDEIYRRILRGTLLKKDMDADYQAPLYFKTTKEMLDDFNYLSDEKAYEIVVTNTNKIANMIEKISPISPEKCPPYINNCEKTIKEIAYKKANELYAENGVIPDLVKDRMDKELNSIISNGFSVMYIIAQKLVWKSNEDGYIVGSRGSVGSSFVAYLTGITEVNSLPAHYRCPNCKYSDFTNYGYQNGFDLPDKDCPKCGHKLAKDGMDIPFETFLGFNGDKEPDIDLNFSGEYQAKAHRYTEVIFGKGTTFKAGTVGTVAGKTAISYARKYFEEHNIMQSQGDLIRLANGVKGIKKSTGQHPGGIIVVPKGREIYEFTPVQHPADDPETDIITTHFDYHSIDQNLLKLDILGHDDPTMIRMLFDLTGIDPTKVPLDDKETMSIFSSTEALGVTPEQIRSQVGSYGVPEFGTKFVRGMLVDTKPKTFDELIRISGLSHGTDVWLGNAQELIDKGITTLSESICCRDDIMIYLINKGLDPNKSFKIMEAVRKGKVAKGKEDKWPDYKQMMKEHGVPDWYIGSCEKIKYMFPKAHAAAYVTNAFRIAWFKVHEPLAYYAAYFTIRADAFDAKLMCHGLEVVKSEMKRIESLGKEATKKDQDVYSVLEIVQEMYARGFDFEKISLDDSEALKFKITENGKLRPPLNSIPGLGPAVAETLVEGRKERKYETKEDVRIRGKAGKTTMEMLEQEGCLEGMSESNQVSIFDSLKLG